MHLCKKCVITTNVVAHIEPKKKVKSKFLAISSFCVLLSFLGRVGDYQVLFSHLYVYFSLTVPLPYGSANIYDLLQTG